MTAERHSLHFQSAPGDPVDKWEHDDKPREECGVFGVFGSEDASVLTALGLHGLQHRGQEGCGIVSYDGAQFYHERYLGLVGEHFAGGDVPKRMPGTSAIGHTRYATAGGTILRNVQPLFADLALGGFAVAHNGNLTNAVDLRDRLVQNGSIFQSTSDTECILQLIAKSKKPRVVERFVEALHDIEGAYALVALTENMMIGARDPIGIRPLVLGESAGAMILASETCALDMIGARFVRSIEPGEIVVITRAKDGKVTVDSHFPFPRRKARPCIFEFVYFCRPDSVVEGRSVYEIRKRMGRRLAQETGVEADVIVPVPDSGVPAAMGFAAESGVPYELGIIRNHYVGRTFIQPKQEIRALGVRLKHSANRDVIRGKRVVLVDDSIVRGTTSRKIVQMVREAGAKEIHLRSASPPIKHPDFYGIDMPAVSELMAAQMTLEEMRKSLEVDSLGFLSVDGLYSAMGETKRDALNPQFTDHAFTGDYPTPLLDYNNGRTGRESQLPLITENAAE
ncbi:amidophosphoribosyltransferase [Candidatus Viadribacter manganicus]|uniref:Amidophosphoribosyltransferase n=1 Tax=Candidatus Viadribacter manganicus TaxID=1759059 RepID=A0A1B1AE14_9PROT|nr:amidophosphoribosyltransferase [Candidatus Viadribacter manganicus]ANP44797.1 amidophosphoribosyltransferase [Candidatus Viadribacter manganicus]